MRPLVFFLLLVLSGCIRPSDPVWTTIPSTSQLLSHLAATAGRYSTLDGVATVSLTMGEKFFSSQQFLLLEKPDHLRTDVLTGFGQLVLQLGSDGEELSVFINHTVPGRFLRGPASYENISRFFHIPLATEELLALLLFDPPIFAYQESRVEIGADTVTLILTADKNRQELLFDQQLQLIGCRYFNGSEKYLSVNYKKFSTPTGFPYIIDIVLPLEQTQVKVRFSELKLNETIDGIRFHLQKPDNILLEELL